MKKLVPLALAALVFAGCEQKKELHIYTWSDYIAPEVIQAFEEANDCTVVVDTFDSNEAMYAKLKAGGTGYDIIMPSSYQIATMAREGMIVELDHTKLPNVRANFDPRFAAQILDPTFKFNVPYAVTYTGFMYLKDKIPSDANIASWAILGTDALRGKISLLDDQREVIGAGLMYLGYSINSDKAEEIDAAVEQILKWRQNVRKFDAESYKTEVASGATFVGHGYSTDATQVIVGDEESGAPARDDIGFALPKEGMDFFTATREMCVGLVWPEDLKRFLTVFTREGVLSEIEQNGIFALTYRLLVGGKPLYVQLKAAMVDEKEGHRLIVGINDVDAQIRQEENYAMRLAQAQNEANIDALTGVKNRHAYLAAEERLDRQIKENPHQAFAIVILDVNDLKKVNDTAGHQAGDQYLRDACAIICDIFKRSPVFRVGGDEFVVIAQGRDYAAIDDLIGSMNAYNAEAIRSGGVVIACGMARYENDASVTPVFERADHCMYENKNALKAAAAKTGETDLASN